MYRYRLVVFLVLSAQTEYLNAMLPLDDPFILVRIFELQEQVAVARHKKIDTALESNVDKAECQVCFEPYSSVSRKKIVLSCAPKEQHHFCKPCLTQWHTKNGTCPLCRKSFTLPPKQISIWQRLLHGFGCITCSQE